MTNNEITAKFIALETIAQALIALLPSDQALMLRNALQAVLNRTSENSTSRDLEELVRENLSDFMNGGAADL